MTEGGPLRDFTLGWGTPGRVPANRPNCLSARSLLRVRRLPTKCRLTKQSKNQSASRKSRLPPSFLPSFTAVRRSVDVAWPLCLHVAPARSKPGLHTGRRRVLCERMADRRSSLGECRVVVALGRVCVWLQVHQVGAVRPVGALVLPWLAGGGARWRWWCAGRVTLTGQLTRRTVVAGACDTDSCVKRPEICRPSASSSRCISRSRRMHGCAADTHGAARAGALAAPHRTYMHVTHATYSKMHAPSPISIRPPSRWHARSSSRGGLNQRMRKSTS